MICTLVILLFTGCSSVERVEHIEVYVIETSEQNSSGLFEQTGYKKVNAITTSESSDNHIKVDLKSIQDFYDKDGNYLETIISHSYSNQSKVVPTESGDGSEMVLHEPSTILIPDDKIGNNQAMDTITDEEKEAVKKHILSYIEKLK